MQANTFDWKRPLWIGLLVAASVAFTFGLACAMPFAAICAVAACTLPRRDAYALTAAVWLANQAVGFCFLHYPWNATTLAWGAGIGLAALASTLAARIAVLRLEHLALLVRYAVVFLAAFAVNEVLLFAFSLWLGGTENFTPAIQLKILGLNALAWAGLLLLHGVGTVVGIATPRARRVA